MSGEESSSSGDIPKNMDPKEAIKLCNTKITKLDQTNNELLDKIADLERETELLRAQKEVQLKKREDSNGCSQLFSFLFLIILSLIILFRKKN